MNIQLENINLSSNSGPNSFASKLIKYKPANVAFDNAKGYDASLCFIESRVVKPEIPLFLRMDGIA